MKSGEVSAEEQLRNNSFARNQWKPFLFVLHWPVHFPSRTFGGLWPVRFGFTSKVNVWREKENRGQIRGWSGSTNVQVLRQWSATVLRKPGTLCTACQATAFTSGSRVIGCVWCLRPQNTSSVKESLRLHPGNKHATRTHARKWKKEKNREISFL